MTANNAAPTDKLLPPLTEPSRHDFELALNSKELKDLLQNGYGVPQEDIQAVYSQLTTELLKNQPKGSNAYVHNNCVVL